MDDQADLKRQSDWLYARYVKPLEQSHAGEYAAVSSDGALVLAKTLPDVMKKAEQEIAPGTFLFKVGDVAVDAWR